MYLQKLHKQPQILLETLIEEKTETKTAIVESVSEKSTEVSEKETTFVVKEEVEDAKKQKKKKLKKLKNQRWILKKFRARQMR